MMKKLFTLAATALMVSGAWGETIDNNQGVIYTLGTSSSTSTQASSPESSTNVTSVTTTNYSSGRLDMKITTTSYYDVTVTQPISISSFNSTNVTIGGWSTKGESTPDSNNGEGAEVIINKGDSNWDTYKNYAINFSNTDNVYSYDQIETLLNESTNLKEITKVYSPAGTENSWQQWSEKKTDYKSSFCYYRFFSQYEDEDEGDITISKFYAIKTIVYVPVTHKYNTTTTNYTITSIPAGLSWKSGENGINSVTIGSTITSIAEGAFANAPKLNYYSSSSSYEVENEHKLLYTDNYEKLVSVAANMTGTYALNTACTGYYANAAANCENLTLTTTRTDFDNSKELGGKNCKLIKPSATLTKTDHPTINYARTYKVTGNMSAANFDAFKSKLDSSSCYDLTEVNVLENIGEVTGLPHNTLLFFGKIGEDDRKVLGDNIVYTVHDSEKNKDVYKCSRVVMYGTAPFVNTIGEIDAAQGDLVRTFKNEQWATIMIPFDFGDITENTWVGQFSKYDPATGIITFSKIKSTEGGKVVYNQPYVIMNKAGQNVPMLGKPSVTVYKSTGSDFSYTNNGLTFTGVYDTFTVTNDILSNKDIYGFNKDGLFKHASNGATFKQFRGYFSLPKSASNASELRTVFIDEDGEEYDVNFGSETEIEAIEEVKSEEPIYNLNGAVMNTADKPGLYIKNGKKIIVK